MMKQILLLSLLLVVFSPGGMAAVRNAELQLGTPKEKFLSFGYRFHDYNCLEAVAYLEAGYQVTNLDLFALKPVKNSSTVVCKGAEKRVDPFDIRLTSDLARQ